MNLAKSRPGHTPKLMIIPMIDIVFFLLVFFMMNTLQQTEQQSIPVNLPAAASARPEVVKSVQVTVGRDHQVYLGKEPLTLLALKERLQQEAGNGDVMVVLAADREVDYGDFIGVMDELKTSGIRRISLAASRGQGR